MTFAGLTQENYKFSKPAAALRAMWKSCKEVKATKVEPKPAVDNKDSAGGPASFDFSLEYTVSVS